MPRLTITEFSKRADLLSPDGPVSYYHARRAETRPHMIVAWQIFYLLAQYAKLYGDKHPLGHALREIEKRVSA